MPDCHDRIEPSTIREQVADGWERCISFEPGFDCKNRHTDESPNHGIASMQIRFVLVGPHGATQFLLSTGFFPTSVSNEKAAPIRFGDGSLQRYPVGYDIGYHSPEPLFDGRTSMESDCRWVEGECYYDGSSLAAEDLAATFQDKGVKAVWKELEQWYDNRLGEVPEEVRYDGD